MSLLVIMDKYLAILEKGVVCVGIVTATTVVFINVILRYLFSYSFSWGEEVAKYLMVWVAMFGSSLCIRKGIHVRIDTIERLLTKPSIRSLYSFISLICGLFMIYFFYNGLILVLKVKATGQVSPSMEIFPMYILFIAIPSGALLMGIQFFRLFWVNITNAKITMAIEKKE